MLKEEARWLGQTLLKQDSEELYPLLDVASSGEAFWTLRQPWIGKEIWGPVGEAGGEVVHTDVEDVAGVDLAGDLYDDRFLERLREMGFRSLLVANLLEHVREPAQLAQRLLSILPAGGLLFVTVPHRYPYHASPIDTQFRPSIGELHALFPSTTLRQSEVVRAGTYWDDIDRRPLTLVTKVLRLALPFYAPRGWLTVASHLGWLNRNFEVTCLVLRKNG